jgi:hypothetical protein
MKYMGSCPLNRKKLSEVWAGDPGYEIRDLEKNLSRIRIQG